MLGTGGVVGLVSPRFPPAIGGVERHVEVLSRELVRRGQKLEILATDPTGSLKATEQQGCVRLRRFPTWLGDGTYFLSPAMAWWLLRHVQDFELLHVHSYHTLIPLFGALAAARAGVPLVFTPHYHGNGHSRFRRALHPPYRVIGKWILRHSALVICVTKAEEEVLRLHFGDSLPTVVIPNGVDVEEMKRAEPEYRVPGRHLVLTTGRLEHYKQIDAIIQATPYLPGDFDVAIVGCGPTQRDLEQLIRELGVGDRVRLLGNVPRSQLAALYKSADVLVTMSREEAFGLVILEAGVAGAHVVASDIPAHREVADYLLGGIAFVPVDESPRRLAAAVTESAARCSPPEASAKVPTWGQVAALTEGAYRTTIDRFKRAAVLKANFGRSPLWSQWRDWRLANR